MGKVSRDKGKRGEREVVQLLKRYWGCPDARRSAQVDGGLSADIVGGPPGMHLEVKHHKKIGACRFMDQAVNDAAGEGMKDPHRRPGRDTGPLPVVLMREDGGPWLVVFHAALVERFVDRYLQGPPDGE